jgi:GNAT superfamily N-acetyltransferase
MIRRATVDDLPAITTVRVSVTENHLSVEDMAARGITPEMIAAKMQRGALAGWVSEADGDIVAFAMADRDKASLWALFTHPAHEAQGHGGALLAAAEQWLKSQGLQAATLDTARGSRAEAFYRRRGWREYQPADPNPLDVYLRKDL